MKKIAALAAALLALTLALTSCGTKELSSFTQSEKEKYISIEQYKGLVIDKKKMEESIQEDIDALLEKKATTNEVTDRAAKEGDTVNIDYKGYIKDENGEWETEPFKNGSATGSDLKLGSDTMIEGFEDAIIGFNSGEEKDIFVTFPEEYKNNPDMQGKEAKFTVKVNKITETILPELTDDFIAENTDYKTLDEYRASLEDDYKNDQIISLLLQKVTVKEYPEDNVRQYYDNLVNTYRTYATNYGMSLSQFCQQYLNKTEEVALRGFVDQAKNSVKQNLALLLIADMENITVSDEEYTKRANEMLEDSSYTTIEELEKAYTKDGLRTVILEDIVVDFLVDNVSVEEIPEEDDGDETTAGDKEEEPSDTSADSSDTSASDETTAD